jgi:hypothetical protein
MARCVLAVQAEELLQLMDHAVPEPALDDDAAEASASARRAATARPAPEGDARLQRAQLLELQACLLASFAALLTAFARCPPIPCS